MILQNRVGFLDLFRAKGAISSWLERPEVAVAKREMYQGRNVFDPVNPNVFWPLAIDLHVGGGPKLDAASDLTRMFPNVRSDEPNASSSLMKVASILASEHEVPEPSWCDLEGFVRMIAEGEGIPTPKLFMDHNHALASCYDPRDNSIHLIDTMRGQDAILHEISHAITFNREMVLGHGPRFWLTYTKVFAEYRGKITCSNSVSWSLVSALSLPQG